MTLTHEQKKRLIVEINRNFEVEDQFCFRLEVTEAFLSDEQATAYVQPCCSLVEHPR